MVGTPSMLLALAAVAFSGERLRSEPGSPPAASTCCGANRLVRWAVTAVQASIKGDLLVVLSAAAIAWILISKYLMRRHSPVMVTSFVFWRGTIFLVI